MKIFIIVLLLIMVGLAVGYYFGFDYGWERNQKNNDNQTEEVQVNFIESGILARNQDGLKPDTWYLRYDKNGKTGLLAQLTFRSESDIPSTQGQRVKIEGNLFGDVVTVVKITEIKGNEADQPDATNVPFQKSDTYGFYGTLTLNGYLKIEKRVCKPGDMCSETVDAAIFMFDKSDNAAFFDMTNQFAGNTFIDTGAVVIGCVQKDKSRIYSQNDSDATGMVETTITGSDYNKLIASNINQKVQLKLTKPIYTSGRGAPDCYSHFKMFDVL